jgi:hypothetical protein
VIFTPRTSSAWPTWTTRWIDGKFQIQLDNIRESVDAIGVAIVQFGMDDEKVQSIADKVIDALYPIITKGHEQNKADTERR